MDLGRHTAHIKRRNKSNFVTKQTNEDKMACTASAGKAQGHSAYSNFHRKVSDVTQHMLPSPFSLQEIPDQKPESMTPLENTTRLHG